MNDLEKEVKIKIDALFEKAQPLINQARETDDIEILHEAEHYIQRVLNIDPTNIAAIFYIGCIQMLRKHEGLAQVLFSVVYRADKRHVNAGSNLGILYKNNEQRKQAVALYLELIETMEKEGSNLFPNKEQFNYTLADIYSNLGSCFTNNGTPDIALDYYNKSLALKDNIDRDTPRFNMALAYLEKGDYQKGWENYKYYSVVHPDKRVKNYHDEESTTPKWEGDKTQIVAVLGEQGLGDELMFASILPDMMKDTRIIFDCHPRLQNLFKRAWPKAPIYGTRKDMDSVWQLGIKPDSFIPITEVAQFYRNKKEDFSGEAYLKADDKLKQLLPKTIKKKSKRLKIGFSWTGGLMKTNGHFRTIAFDQLLRILKCDADFISLQYKPEHNEQLMKVAKENKLKNVFVYQDIIDDYDLTACLLDELDFIVCAPQSVIFLAGALGVETYQLCPKRGMWQQGVYGEGMPWFNSVHNIWQQEFNDWDYCIDEAVRVINEKIDKR